MITSSFGICVSQGDSFLSLQVREEQLGKIGKQESLESCNAGPAQTCHPKLPDQSDFLRPLARLVTSSDPLLLLAIPSLTPGFTTEHSTFLVQVGHLALVPFAQYLVLLLERSSLQSLGIDSFDRLALRRRQLGECFRQSRLVFTRARARSR